MELTSPLALRARPRRQGIDEARPAHRHGCRPPRMGFCRQQPDETQAHVLFQCPAPRAGWQAGSLSP